MHSRLIVSFICLPYGLWNTMQALESCFGFLMGTEIHTDSTRSMQAGGIPAVPNDLANAHSSKVAVMRRVAELPASEGASLTLGRTRGFIIREAGEDSVPRGKCKIPGRSGQESTGWAEGQGAGGAQWGNKV